MILISKVVMMFNSFWNKKKILITGNTGFKGSWLSIWLLMLGADVYGYSLKPNCDQKLFNNIFIDNNDIKHFSGNLFIRQEISGI